VDFGLALRVDAKVLIVSDMEFTDEPKILGDADALSTRLSMTERLNVSPLTKFVEQLREEKGPTAKIPYFDPWDGGIDAEVLFLLEAPGAKARNSGFVSRNNPDETAKNFFDISVEASLARRRTVIWNVVPWYIGSEVKIRPANSEDIMSGKASLEKLLSLLPKLRAIVMMGRKAQRAKQDLLQIAPRAKLFNCPHPSPMYVNRSAENRDVIVNVFKEVAEYLGD
jgi:uracil-DNA glycosylase